MKKIFLLAAMIAFVATTFAQKLNYQAVVRDGSQRLLSNKAVTANVLVKENGTQKYVETINGTTNMQGLLTFSFGDATFANMDWSNATISVEVKDAATSVVYVPAEDRPVNAVPYALIAGNAQGQVNADWNATEGKAQILNKPSLSTVATSGSYNDLSDKPTIPAAANDATLTIQKNGTAVGTFTANASANETINITVPTQTSELTNNSGFITSADVPTNVSSFTNDAGYVSNSNCPAVNICDLDSTITSLQGTITSMQTAFDDSMDSLKNEVNTLASSIGICGTYKVKDYDNNEYNTVQIGNQCWMKENLRTTHYADGNAIAKGSTISTDVGYWYYPQNSSSNKTTYGLLYNWKAVMRNSAATEANPSGVQGICPTGWHVPSDAEWTQLANYVSSQSAYQCGDSSSNNAKALASTTGWNSSTKTCAVGNTPSDNNATGFSVVPAGYYTDSGTYLYFGIAAYFWSTTQYYYNISYCQAMYYGTASLTDGAKSNYEGLSVRCVRDEKKDADSVSTSCCDTLTAKIDNLQRIIARQDSILTVQNQILTEQDSIIEALTNKVFPFSCGTSKVKDYDKNLYNTVQIGSQCWMKENLKTTHYADGTAIDKGNTTSFDVGYWYYPNNSVTNKTSYGLLYNWKAVMRNSAASAANPSGVQGICPKGWHVPSDAEWTQLTNYVSSQSAYQCGGSSSNNAKALASTTGWDSSTNTCAVGNTPGNNNATGFSAVPAGYYHDSNYNSFGRDAHFWSATLSSSSDYYAYTRALYDYNAYVINGEGYHIDGYSVRCVRD